MVAGVTLAIATVTYYSLVLFVSQRWHVDPSNLEPGAASSAGMLSVGRSFVFWTVGGLIGGGFMGWLGWAIRDAPIRLASGGLGVSFALLIGEGVFTLIHVRSIYQGPLDSFDLSKLIPSLIQIVLGTLSVGFAASLRRQPMSWRISGGIGAASIVASVLLWYALSAMRMEL